MPTSQPEIQNGLIYRNPVPHLRSVDAAFPSLAVAANGKIYCSLVLGEAFEALNCRAFLISSTDSGRTWSDLKPFNTTPPGAPDSESARITALPDGTLRALTFQFHRAGHLEESPVNPKNMGFVPSSFHQYRFREEEGRFEPLGRITPPLEYGSYELCSPISIMSDGIWLLPTCAFRSWDQSPSVPYRTGAFVSHDEGRSWPEFMPTFVTDEKKVFWETKIIELADGRWLSVAWVYNEKIGADEPNAYVMSADKGRTWTQPRSTGLSGQTATPIAEADGSILCVYRRTDEPGLWAQRVVFEGDKWINKEAFPIWGANSRAGLTHKGENSSENFSRLRFGAPCLVRLPDRSILGAFWCYEDCVSNIRWFHLPASS